VSSACRACPVAPEDGTGVGLADRTGMVNFLACLDLEQNISFPDGPLKKQFRPQVKFDPVKQKNTHT